MNPGINRPLSNLFGPSPGHLFPLGKLLATRGALEMLNAHRLSPVDFIVRHETGDWGDLDPEDRKANDRALVIESRLLSSYQIDTTTRLWIITEADRSVTTLLLPEEY